MNEQEVVDRSGSRSGKQVRIKCAGRPSADSRPDWPVQVVWPEDLHLEERLTVWCSPAMPQCPSRRTRSQQLGSGPDADHRTIWISGHGQRAQEEPEVRGRSDSDILSTAGRTIGESSTRRSACQLHTHSSWPGTNAGVVLHLLGEGRPSARSAPGSTWLWPSPWPSSWPRRTYRLGRRTATE
ncbi:MAG: hypothetical protein JWQ81_2694 [Amycolatopsis sp.]|nr:hypothetical protein [Amycolatopsis sp.]